MHGVQLAEAAVQQNHIRAVGIAHPLKAPGQDFFHHGKVIIGDIGIFDVKRPILFLVKAIGGGDNHGPYRVTALNMRVVIDLNPPRYPRKIENLFHFFKVLSHRSFHGNFALQRSPGVFHRHLNNFGLIALRIGIDFGANGLF